MLFSTYIPQVQDLLDDPNAQLWSTAQLANYINEARNRVAQETKALRQVINTNTYPTLTLNSGQESYNLPTYLPTPFNTTYVDVMGITVLVNNERYRMQDVPYTEMDAFMRGWVNYVDWPIAMSRVGANTINIAYVPNQTYNCEFDLAINPNALVLDTDPEQIPQPFQEPVQYYAAYKAKIRMQAHGEAMFFFKQYEEILKRCCKAWRTRIIRNPYMSRRM